MASLTLTTGLEIVTGTSATEGQAKFTIDTTNVPKVEIWERTIPFPPPGPMPLPPAFTSGGVFANMTFLSRNVPLAHLYQVRLYREGEGNAAGDGNVLDQLNFPCVLKDGGRTNFLTRCADKPQLDITAGGTFVSLAFAANTLTMARAQLSRREPQFSTDNLPTFQARSAVATAHSASTGPKLLHKLVLSDEQMLPGDQFFFVILVWDATGKWDFVWHPDAIAPSAPPIAPSAAPQKITTKQRLIDVRLTKLHYLDDSDSTTNGEGNFSLIVQQGAPPVPPKKETLGAATFATGTSLPVVPPMKITLGPEVVAADQRNVSVRVTGFDGDMSGVPDGDDSDSADTGAIPLALPTGEGKEEVIDRSLVLIGHPSGGDDTLRFLAEVLYSVTYQ